MNQLAFVTFAWIASVYNFGVVGTQETNALECYSCTHANVEGCDVGEVNCKDPFVMDGVSTIQCNGTCVKVTLESDIPTITRSCHSVEEVDDCVHLDHFELDSGGFLSQNCCNSDLCNSGCIVTFNLSALGAAAMVALFVAKV